MTLQPIKRTLFSRSMALAATITLIVLLVVVYGVCQTQSDVIRSLDSLALRNVASKRDTRRSETLIRPGISVGLLSIGDSRERARKIFPFKAGQDQEWTDDCGTTFNWVDRFDNVPGAGGNVFVKFKNEKVFQIESATTRFHTVRGVSIYDTPERVRASYERLRAYVLKGAPVTALGDRPLVFWVDKSTGIAFVFAFDRRLGSRYVYKIIVFKPNSDLCPEDQTTESPNWQEIAPYALEPPDTAARLRQLLLR